MRTIGFISKEENSTLYINISESDCNIAYKSNDFVPYYKNEIVSVEFNENVVELMYPEKENSEWRFKHGVNPIIEKISHFDDIEYESLQWIDWYDQVLLYYIVKNDFTTLEFQKEILYDRVNPISKILLNDYFKDVVTNNPNLNQILSNYVDKISIDDLIKNRKINIIDKSYEKDGHNHLFYTFNYSLFSDNYLNRLLLIIPWSPGNGSYAYATLWYKDEGKEKFHKLIKTTEEECNKKAKINYSKEEHLEFLINQCKRIQHAYEVAKSNTFFYAKHKLGFTLD